MSVGVLAELALGEHAAVARSRRNASTARWRRWLLGILVPAALLMTWFVGSATGLLPAVLLPSPQKVGAAVVDFFAGASTVTLPGVVRFNGAGWEHIGASLWRCAVSFTAAVVVGVSVGLAIGLSRLVSDLLDPLVNALRAVPLYAWLPLVLVWFGIGEGAARVLIFIGALWPVLIATADAVGRVPRGHIETARMLGTPARRLWRRVYLPSVLPEVVTGLRLSLTLAWMCVIVGELSGTREGVGAMMNAARESGRVDQIVVGILVFAVIGLLADLALRLAARPFIRWNLT